jgi:hypothetical protein
MATFNYFLLHFRTRLVEFLSVKPLELLLLSHLVLGSILPLFAEGNHERIDQRCCASFQSEVFNDDLLFVSHFVNIPESQIYC